MSAPANGGAFLSEIGKAISEFGNKLVSIAEKHGVGNALDSVAAVSRMSTPGQTEEKTGARKRIKKRVPKDVDAPKKPLSGYLLFCQEQRPLLHKEHPDLGNKELVTRMAAMWDSLEDKAQYKERARELHQAYQEALHEYEARKKARLEGDSDAADAKPAAIEYKMVLENKPESVRSSPERESTKPLVSIQQGKIEPTVASKDTPLAKPKEIAAERPKDTPIARSKDTPSAKPKDTPSVRSKDTPSGSKHHHHKDEQKNPQEEAAKKKDSKKKSSSETQK